MKFNSSIVAPVNVMKWEKQSLCPYVVVSSLILYEGIIFGWMTVPFNLIQCYLCQLSCYGLSPKRMVFVVVCNQNWFLPIMNVLFLDQRYKQESIKSLIRAHKNSLFSYFWGGSYSIWELKSTFHSNVLPGITIFSLVSLLSGYWTVILQNFK